MHSLLASSQIKASSQTQNSLRKKPYNIPKAGRTTDHLLGGLWHGKTEIASSFGGLSDTELIIITLQIGNVSWAHSWGDTLEII
jgi:hypothetical protein